MKMKKNYFLIIVVFFVFLSVGCNSSDSSTQSESEEPKKISSDSSGTQGESTELKKISELKAGDKFSGMTVVDVSTDDVFHSIVFKDEITIEGKLLFSDDPTMFIIDYNLFTSDLVIKGDELLKLTEQRYIALVQGVDIKTYLPDDYFEEGTQGWRLKDSEDNKHTVKLTIKDVLYESDNMFPIQVTVSKILEIDGKEI